MPTTAFPVRAKARSRAQATRVLPTPVSVPVTKNPRPTFGRPLRRSGVHRRAARAQFAERSSEAQDVILPVRRGERDAQPGGAFRYRRWANCRHENAALPQRRARPYRLAVFPQDERLNRRIRGGKRALAPPQLSSQHHDQLSQPLAAPFVLPDELKTRVDRGREHSGRGRGVDIGPRPLQHRFHYFRSARDESARHSCRLAERSDVDEAWGAQAEVRRRAATFGAEHAERVRVVDQKPGVVAFAQIEQRRQQRDVAVHAEYAIGDDQPRSRAGFGQRSRQETEIGVRVANHPGARQAHAVDQRSVIECVGENRILRAGERGNGADICLIAGGKKQRPRHLHELGELRFEALVEGAVPAQKMRGALPDPVTRGGFDRRLYDPRMVGEPQVIIAAERKALLPVHDDARPLRALADKAAAAQAAALEFGELFGQALKDQGRITKNRGSCSWFEARKRMGAPHRPGAIVVLARYGGPDLLLVEVGDFAAGPRDRDRLKLHSRAHFQIDAAPHGAGQALAHGNRAVPAHQGRRGLSQCPGERLPQIGRLDQQIGALLRVADFEVRDPLPHERSHVEKRPHRDHRDAERHDRGRMIVHDRVYVRTRLEDLAVNEALAHRLSSPRIDRAAVQIVLHDVLGHHQFRRERARQKIALGVAFRAHAYVSVSVDDAVLGENSIGRDEVFDQVHLFPLRSIRDFAYSPLMPAVATTRDQRASSLFTRSPKRSGVPPAGAMPCFARSSRISLCVSRAFISVFTLAITARGVPAGASTPYQVSTSRSARPSSLSVGTSENAGERSALITASMRSFPLWTYGAAVCSDTIMACTCPPTRSASAPPDPLYGTCTRSMRASSLSSSIARCCGPPLPGEE